jgi:hypothetical protein
VTVRPNIPEDGPIKPKYVEKEIVWRICITNCVDGNKNKTTEFSFVSTKRAIYGVQYLSVVLVL